MKEVENMLRGEFARNAIYKRGKCVLKVEGILDEKAWKGEKLTDNEIEELIDEINPPLAPHPLMDRYYGYRRFFNNKAWTCHFCEKKIEEHEGYWGHKEMYWSHGAKLCHMCFLKFLIMMDENFSLMLLLEIIRGKEDEISRQFAFSE